MVYLLEYKPRKFKTNIRSKDKSHYIHITAGSSISLHPPALLQIIESELKIISCYRPHVTGLIRI